MRILLVNPEFPETYWSFRHALPFEGKRCVFPPLSLLSVSGLLPRSHQIQIVRRAVALVQPSLFEGWSAVVEDARTFGKRIYLSDLAVHREQDPPDAVFFDAHAPEQLADLIAGDWSQLRPGPDPERERQAFAEQTLRARLFAQTFLGILDKALGRKLARV